MNKKETLYVEKSILDIINLFLALNSEVKQKGKAVKILLEESPTFQELKRKLESVKE